jgi:hypothetical protein
MNRRTSDVMKTKSVVTPSKIQITALNLKRLALGVGRVKDAIIRLPDG